jgi:hypothetical protein
MTSSEDLLAEYRRLYRIEDAAKALLVGRLRDVPEEEMAPLWTALVRTVDAPRLPYNLEVADFEEDEES